MRYFDDHQAGNANQVNNQHMLKEKNIRSVFSIINYCRGISRIQISKMTGLTPTTITSLVDDLLKMNLIKESGQALSGSAGRKPTMLQTNPEGVQIPVFRYRAGGIMFSLFDLSFQTLDTYFTPFKQPVDSTSQDGQSMICRETDGSEYVEIMMQQLTEHAPHLDMSRVQAICITIPGTYEWNEERFSSSVLRVRGSTAFFEEFRKRTGGVPLLVSNESDCFAYAQATDLSSEARDLVFVNVGAGVGAGIVLNGEIYMGTDGLAGEIGHNSIDLNGKVCSCGNRGCVERYICQSAIIERIWEAACKDAQCAILNRIRGDYSKLTWDVVCEAYQNGDPVVCEIINQKVVYELNCAVNNLTTILNVHHMVLGGGVEELGEGFLNNLKAATRRVGFVKGLKPLQMRYPNPAAGGASIGAAKFFVDKHMRFSIN